MSEFEFVLIPVGIVIGLALAMILQSWGYVVRDISQTTKPTLFLSATALSLLLILLNFSGIWTYRGVQFAFSSGPLVFVMPLALILPILVHFMAVSVIVPRQIDSSTNLYDHYFSVSRKFWILVFLANLVALIPDLLPGVGWTLSFLEISPGFLLPLFLAASKLRWVHISGHCVWWLITIAGYGYNFSEYLGTL